MVFKRLLARFTSPGPSGPPQVLRRFATPEPLLSQDGVTIEDAAWRIDVTQPQTVRLFEIADPSAEESLLTYRARLKSDNVQGRAYLELWCRLPGSGEFFSKGLQQAVSGTVDWATYEVPFLLKRGQRPDLLKLNLAVEGTGTIWVTDVEVLSTPLA
jgi:hypothetical protein